MRVKACVHVIPCIVISKSKSSSSQVDGTLVASSVSPHPCGRVKREKEATQHANAVSGIIIGSSISKASSTLKGSNSRSFPILVCEEGKQSRSEVSKANETVVSLFVFVVAVKFRSQVMFAGTSVTSS